MAPGANRRASKEIRNNGHIGIICVSQAATCRSGPSTGTASNAAIDRLGSSLEETDTPAVTGLEGFMLDPQKALEREALLKRIRELDAEIAQHEGNLCEGEDRLPIEEQLRLKLRRFIEASIPELVGKVRVKISESK
jgi:hypothetical protein